MKKISWAVGLAIGLTILSTAENATALTKRPRETSGEKVMIKTTRRPPDSRDMQVSTGQISPANEEESR